MSQKKPFNSTSSNSSTVAIPLSLKKFRQSPEIEGFYRFVYENDLRVEAFAILDRVTERRNHSKKIQGKA